jgi:rubrerythrin
MNQIELSRRHRNAQNKVHRHELTLLESLSYGDYLKRQKKKKLKLVKTNLKNKTTKNNKKNNDKNNSNKKNTPATIYYNSNPLFTFEDHNSLSLSHHKADEDEDDLDCCCISTCHDPTPFSKGVEDEESENEEERKENGKEDEEEREEKEEGEEGEETHTETEEDSEFDFLVSIPKADAADYCSICMSFIDEKEIIRLLPCHHLFHRKCIDIWLTGNLSWEGNNTRACPLCKHTIDFQKLRIMKEKESEVKVKEESKEDTTTIPKWAFVSAITSCSATSNIYMNIDPGKKSSNNINTTPSSPSSPSLSLSTSSSSKEGFSFINTNFSSSSGIAPPYIEVCF